MNRTEFLNRLKDRLERLQLPGGHWLVAVSGGPDSVALLRGLVELKPPSVGLVVAHLNHGLRPGAAEQDEAFVAALAKRLGLAFDSERTDVAAVASREGLSIETAARDCRYRFLREAAARWEASVVALGHTADDQAETILHRILRGTGLAGLAGISEDRLLNAGCRLIRPLLEFTRADILDYLGALGQDFCRDESNFELGHTRNRLRGDLIPKLEAEYNPQVRESLLRLGRLAQEAQAALNAWVARLWDEAIAECDASAVVLRIAPLAACPRHIVRELFVLVWQRQGWPLRELGYEALDHLATLAQEGGPALTLPGNIDARREGAFVLLVQDSKRADAAPSAQLAASVPGAGVQGATGGLPASASIQDEELSLASDEQLADRGLPDRSASGIASN